MSTMSDEDQATYRVYVSRFSDHAAEYFQVDKLRVSQLGNDVVAQWRTLVALAVEGENGVEQPNVELLLFELQEMLDRVENDSVTLVMAENNSMTLEWLTKVKNLTNRMRTSNNAD